VSELIHFEYPPPRSWEQFEELCADLFEVMWSDPGLARHGRAGQAQCGVDIVAARGSVYPVGLQCKKKSRWPIKKLSIAEVDHEVEEAEKFSPPLKELYLLTTAVGDERLQLHVRTLNESRKKQSQFPVEVLFWPEIVRRVARFDEVARKHFPIAGGKGEFSPLLATWYTNDGRLELAGDDWHLAVSEVGEDFHEWPTGRVIVRQRETDAMVTRLQKMENHPASSRGRAAKLELRRELRYMRNREKRIQETIRKLFTIERLKFYMLDLDEKGVDAREILKSIIEHEMHRGLKNARSQKIRISPPTPHLLPGPRSSMSMADADIAIDMSSSEYAQILKTEKEFPEKYHGNAIAKVVSELPPIVRTRLAIPAVIRRIERIMEEDHKTFAQMELAGYLDLNQWKYKH
jgi:hypothetical protein